MKTKKEKAVKIKIGDEMKVDGRVGIVEAVYPEFVLVKIRYGARYSGLQAVPLK